MITTNSPGFQHDLRALHFFYSSLDLHRGILFTTAFIRINVVSPVGIHITKKNVFVWNL